MSRLRTIKHIVIVGGGTAGWMAANILRVHMRNCRITLVESSTISTIRVGEALTPPFHMFLHYLGIHPLEFVRRVQGSVKLAE